MGNLKGAVLLKCPRCEKGDLYEAQNPYKMGKMMEMHKNCSNCGLRYEKEAGFFYGAMYVSYMLNMAFFVVTTVLWYTVFEDKLDWRLYIGSYVLLTVLLVPIIFRYSRSLWLMMMIKFEPEKRGER